MKKPSKRPAGERQPVGDATTARVLSVMVALAEESARLDLLAHSVGLMFNVPKGAFSAAMRARRGLAPIERKGGK